ncbi:MAG TPA: cytochrome C [Aurantimonas sp.]|jgi:cytochrome c1|nr:cytochrome C [Aurantimonas sp.]
MKRLVVLACLLVSGCTEEAPETVRLLVAAHGCGTCHVIRGIPGATGRTGPPLVDYGRQVYVAGVVPNTHETLARFIMDPQAIDPRTAMPDLGVTAEEADLLAAFLRAGP